MTEAQTWKPSYFNVTLGHDGKQLLFNSRTAQIMEMNARGWAVIQECFDGLLESGAYSNSELLECLVTLGFVVPAGLDEHQQENDRLQQTKASEERLFLTIAPTMACNQRCSYCFQRNTPKTKIMSAEMQRAVIEFVRRKIGNSNQLLIQWFGGEPLIAYGTIVSMTKAFQAMCAQRGIHYHAEMLTNGTLLTPERVAALRTLEIKALQISLDGMPETYAKRREVTLPKAEAYYRFLAENLQAIVDATGSVTIRINVDKKNAEEAMYVVRFFKDHGVVDQRIDFRLGFINTSRGLIECVPHDCFTNSEFAEEELAFRRFLADQGYMVFGMPQAKNYTCTAILRNAYTVDPNGNVGKCIPAVGTNHSVFARILPNDMERTLVDTAAAKMPYYHFDPNRSKGCNGCRLMPVCLGSCPKHHVNDERIVDCSMLEGLSGKLAFYHRFHKRRSEGRPSA